MAEVIKFPKDKIAYPPQNEAELAASMEQVKNKLFRFQHKLFLT